MTKTERVKELIDFAESLRQLVVLVARDIEKGRREADAPIDTWIRSSYFAANLRIDDALKDPKASL